MDGARATQLHTTPFGGRKPDQLEHTLDRNQFTYSAKVNTRHLIIFTGTEERNPYFTLINLG